MANKTFVPFRVSLGVPEEFVSNRTEMLADGLRFTERLQENVRRFDAIAPRAYVIYLNPRRGSLIHEAFLVISEASDDLLGLASETLAEVSLSLWLLERLKDTIESQYEGTLSGYRAETGEPIEFPDTDIDIASLRQSFPTELQNRIERGSYYRNRSAKNSDPNRPKGVKHRKFRDRFPGAWGLVAFLIILAVLSLNIANVISEWSWRNTVQKQLTLRGDNNSDKSEFECAGNNSVPLIFDWDWVARADEDQE